MITTERPHLVFLENRDQVSWIKDAQFYRPELTLLAITAEALQALEEQGLPHHSLADIADTSTLVNEEDRYIREIYSCCREIEQYIARHSPDVLSEGPGFLSGNDYILYYSVSAIVKRAYILRAVIEAFSPSEVTAFRKKMDPWFAGCGYTKNPWDEILEKYSTDYSFSLNFITDPVLSENITQRYIDRFFYIYHGTRKRFMRILQTTPKHPRFPKHLHGIRLLFASSTIYDWGPVIARLSPGEKGSLFKLESRPCYKGLWWSTSFTPVIRRLFPNIKNTIPIHHPTTTPDCIRNAESLFDEWLSGRGGSSDILVAGLDVFPYLIPQIRTFIREGIPIIVDTDAFFTEAVKFVRPHAVCFFTITLLSEKRLAYLCGKNGIPTLCYQHGFGYNFQIQPKDEGCDQAYADFFLTYGSGNNPRADPVFPVRAGFIPAGSARIEEMRGKYDHSHRKRKGTTDVLWIADSTTQNTIVLTLTEDTKRYRIQKRCLDLLAGNKNVRVVYRPLVSQVGHDGTSSWIRHRNCQQVSIDPYTPLEELIIKADLVILDISSPTTWGEVFGLKKPLILYCDPKQTPINETCISDLENACCWCKSEEDFTKTVHQCSLDPNAFIKELEKTDTAPFLEKYILADGRCARNVYSLLEKIFKTAKNENDCQ